MIGKNESNKTTQLLPQPLNRNSRRNEQKNIRYDCTFLTQLLRTLLVVHMRARIHRVPIKGLACPGDCLHKKSFKHTQMIYTGYVKVAPGKPLTGQEKLRISPGREDKFSLGEGKNPLGRGFTECGTEGVVNESTSDFMYASHSCEKSQISS